MIKYGYHVDQQRPDVHPHNPNGEEDVATDDFELAASWIARGVVQFDVGEDGDVLTVWRDVNDKRQFTISEELRNMTRDMQL